MIDPREVRSGNWVIKMTGAATNAQTFYEYKAIDFHGYTHSFAKLCFPILLTPAVLGVSGFKHEFGDWYRNRPSEGIDEGLPFLRYHHSDSNWYLGKMKLPSQPLYLHQLQNLVYALTHEELDIHLGPFENRMMTGGIGFLVMPLERY